MGHFVKPRDNTFHKAATKSDSLTHISFLSFSSNHPSKSHPNYPFNNLTTTTMATPTQQEQEPTWPHLLGANNWEGLLDPLNLHLRNLILRCGDFIQATYDAFNNDQNSIYCGSSRYGKSSFFHKVMLTNPSHYTVTSFLYATARVSVPQAFLLHSFSRESWDRESNWIGYIVVTSDEVARDSGRREIYVVWRGTTRNYEWVNVFGAAPESAKGLLSAKTLKELNNGNSGGRGGGGGSSSSSDDEDDERIPKVMKGWLTIYTSDDPKSSFTKLSARTQVLNKVILQTYN